MRRPARGTPGAAPGSGRGSRPRASRTRRRERATSREQAPRPGARARSQRNEAMSNGSRQPWPHAGQASVELTSACGSARSIRSVDCGTTGAGSRAAGTLRPRGAPTRSTQRSSSVRRSALAGPAPSVDEVGGRRAAGTRPRSRPRRPAYVSDAPSSVGAARRRPRSNVELEPLAARGAGGDAGELRRRTARRAGRAAARRAGRSAAVRARSSDSPGRATASSASGRWSGAPAEALAPTRSAAPRQTARRATAHAGGSVKVGSVGSGTS